MMMFVLGVGLSFSTGFDSILLLYMPSTYEVADTVYTYTYRMAFGGDQLQSVGGFRTVPVCCGNCPADRLQRAQPEDDGFVPILRAEV